MATELFSVEQVRAALEASGGIYLGAAAKLKCAPNTVKNMVKRYPELQDAIAEIKENNLDLAETQLIKAIGKGSPWAICFYLKTQGKERGWTERRELTGKGGGPVQTDAVTTYQLPDNGRG
jgi:hypothetical protein